MRRVGGGVIWAVSSLALSGDRSTWTSREKPSHGSSSAARLCSVYSTAPLQTVRSGLGYLLRCSGCRCRVSVLHLLGFGRGQVCS